MAEEEWSGREVARKRSGRECGEKRGKEYQRRKEERRGGRVVEEEVDGNRYFSYDESFCDSSHSCL